MAKIKVIIEDDNGQRVGGEREYQLELIEEATLDEIEEAVEKFRIKIMPEIERELLSESQNRVVKKKQTPRTKRKNSDKD